VHSIKFKDKIQIWESRLIKLSKSLVLLNNVQRRLIYLEPVFGKVAVFQDDKQFSKVDSEFRALCLYIKKDTRLMSFISYPYLLEVLKNLLDTLEKLQKQLSMFLEEKKSKFAQFYFIGNMDTIFA
jgi:dynein heavy chain 2